MKTIFLFVIFLFVKFSIQAQTFFQTDSLIESTYWMNFKDMVECNMDNNIYTNSLLSQNTMTTYNDNFVKSTIAKFDQNGHFIKQINLIKSDTIYRIDHIVNNRNSLLTLGAKSTNQVYNQIRLAWYDTSLNLLNEKLYSIPTNDTGILEFAHFDSLYNNYYCFINSYKNTGQKSDAFILKLNKTTLDSVELFKMDTTYFSFFLSVFVYQNKFKVLFDKKLAYNKVPSFRYNFDTTFAYYDSLAAIRWKWPVFGTSDTSFTPHPYNAQYNSIPLTNNEYLYGVSIGKIYHTDTNNIASGVLKQITCLYKLGINTDSMTKRLEIPYYEAEDSVDENRPPAYYYVVDYVDKNNIYIVNFALHNIKPRGYVSVCNVDSNLNIKWQRFIAGGSYYQAQILRATQDKGILVAGFTRPALFSSDTPTPFIFKLDSVGLLNSTHDVNYEVLRYMCYPNPSKEEINIMSSEKEAFTFYLIEMNGRVVLKENIKNIQNKKINIAHLPTGNYIYKIVTSKGYTESGKWIKE